MRLSRRLLLTALAWSLGGLPARRLWPRAAQAAAPLTALGPYLDILIPDDGASPAATALGVEAALRERAGADPAYQKLLALGCAALDQAARAQGADDFAALQPGAQRALVARLAAAGSDTGAGVFFARTRWDAMDAYYGRAESWPMLGYDGPPQPDGFMDFASPPGRPE